MKPELKHLQRIAGALIAAGYIVEEPSESADLLDIWGFETLPGKNRRRKCFEEIYCVVITVNGLCVSYWTTNKTYDDDCASIEIEETSSGLRGVNELLASLSVAPLKRKRWANHV